MSISRTIGDLLVELSHFDRNGADPPLELFLVADYPLTQEVIETREPRTVVLGTADADPAEAALLERLGFSSLLMLPLRSRGQIWGLVEIWGNGRAFGDDEVGGASVLVERAGELLALLETRA
ncbi:MAG: GAF domain-containing protein [Actinomycetota bacterium]|nr:GAF domain-containing protein [Actinomycetota bacterium]